MIARPDSPALSGNSIQRQIAPYSIILAVLLGLTLSVLRLGTSPISVLSPYSGQSGSHPDLGKLPLNFEPNVGQADPGAPFITRAPGANLDFTPAGVILTLRSTAVGEGENGGVTQAQQSHTGSARSVVHMQFVGANPDVEMERGPSLPGKINYMLGNEPAQWHTDVPTYSEIKYSGLYPGVDLTYGGEGGRLKGTYTLGAGVSPNLISWRYADATGVKLDANGNLLISLPGAYTDTQTSVLTEQAPVAWQEIEGRRVSVQVAYAVAQDGSVGFSLGEYDPSYPLTIDPTLILPYSTYLGGSDQDSGYGIATDGSGNAYITGETYSYDFPIRNELGQDRNGTDAFVSKINTNSAGDPSLIYSTYLGGSSDEAGRGIAVDSAGNAYVIGSTTSNNFPTVNPYQSYQGAGDAFVANLGTTGSTMIYSTYLGGTGLDNGFGIGLGNAGNAYVTGYTESTNFPVLHQYQTVQTDGDVFVTRLDTTLAGNSSLIYSTYLGGTGTEGAQGIAVGTGGNAYVTGYTTSSNFPLLNQAQNNQLTVDAFVTRLDTSRTGNASLIYSTYLGGNFTEQGNGIAVGGSGNVYITGSTGSSDFPIVHEYQTGQGGDAFVTRLDTSLSGLSSIIYSTYLGGSSSDTGYGIAADSAGNAYVTGSTSSTNFPTRDNFQNDQPGDDAFVARLNTNLSNNASLIYSTYLGGEGNDIGQSIAIDASSNVYVTGYTASVSFPTSNQYQSDQINQDTFVSRLSYANATATPTNSPTPTRTPTATRTRTATNTATRTPTPDPCTQPWAVVASANAGTNDNGLTEVAVAGANDIWAVGNVYTGSVFQTLIEHWNGTAWTVVPSPNVGGSIYIELDGVAVAGPNDVWAVGYYDNSSNIDQTLIEHWNGTTWAVVASPNVGTSYNDLTGVAVAGANDVWAVGYYYDGNMDKTLTEHWNGTTWTVVASPNVGTIDNYLSRVAVAGANDVWATGGNYGNGNVDQTLTEHWNGTTWTVVASPNVGTDDNVLSGVAVAGPNSVWAVGYYYDGSILQTLTEHWNGTAWTVVPSPNVSTSYNNLYEVAVVGPGDVWAVGYYRNGSLEQTLTEHWNSTAWTVVASPNAGSGYNYLTGVAVVGANDVWAVGAYDNNGVSQTLTERYHPMCGTATPTATRTSTRTSTPQATGTPTRTHTVAPTQTPGGPSATTIPTNTRTATVTRTATLAPTNTSAPTNTPTRTSTVAPTNTTAPSITPTRTNTVAPTQTPGGPSATPIPTNTSTSTPTRTPTQAPTSTSAPTDTPTSTPSPLPTQTPGGPTATDVPSDTPTPTATAVPTDTAAVPTATACTLQFSDVPNNSTFYPFVHCLACLGIINGYPCGGTGEPCNANNDPYFRTSSSVTRGQLSKIVSNSAGFSDAQPAQLFEDVPVGSTFHDFVGRLSTRGYINGYPCGGAGEPCGSGNLPYFRPNSNATRGQISKIVSNASGFSDPPGAQLFEDVAPGSTFYDFIQRLASREIINGYPCGGAGESCGAGNLPYFRTNNNATRGQTSKIVSNAFFPDCSTSAP